MTKTEKLNNLFDDWMKNSDYETYHRHGFMKDGIIDEAEFEKQEKKVLFISNEANVENYDNSPKTITDRRCQFNEYFNSGIDNWSGKMRERICCLYQVVNQDFQNKKTPYKVANKFAFMNLNKSGGGNICDIENIEDYCKKYKDYIKKEIEIISPDIIIWLGCNTYVNIPIKFDAKDSKDHKYKIIDIDRKQVPIIRMWHTSYTRIRSADRLNKFDNLIIDKMAYKLDCEIKNINFQK